MARNTRRHLDLVDQTVNASGETSINELTPKEITKQEFGRRLHSLMLKNGWNQSELARRAGIGRDAISTYVRGRSFPEPLTLKKIASALSVKAEDLLPNTARSAIDDDEPALSIKQSPGDSNRVWLKANQSVTLDQATRIMAILNGED